MYRARRVARNAFFMTAGQVLSYGMAGVYSILLARYLGAAGLGTLNVGVALTAIFTIFTSFGLGSLTTREVARDNSQASKYLGNIIPIQVLLGLASIVLLAALVNILGYSQQTVFVVYILSAGITLSAVSTLFSAIFQAFERMHFSSAGTIITSAALLCGALIGIALHVSVIGFAFFSVVASGVSLAYSYLICVRKFFVPRLHADLTFWRSILKEAWPLAAMTMSVMLYFRIDVVFLSAFQGAAQIGLYSVAYTLADATAVIPGMFIVSLFPVISQLHSSSKHSFADTCAKSVKYMLYIGLPVALTVTLWAKPIIVTLYGANFAGSAVALQIIIWAAAAMYVGTILGSTFVSANLQRFSMALSVSLVVFNVAINLLIIPKYGYLGASATTVATEVLGVVLALFFLTRFGYNLRLRTTGVPAFFALGTAAAISAILSIWGFHVLIITVIALAVYGAIVYKLGLDEEDKQLIVSIIKNPKASSE
jgi:O-antigen/teichoic acid export membrane protein